MSSYVIGGTLMKYSRGLTRLLPSLALVVIFSAGALVQAKAMRYEQLGPSYVVVLGLEALLASGGGLSDFCRAGDREDTVRSAAGNLGFAAALDRQVMRL